jgi:hypothetical protein
LATCPSNGDQDDRTLFAEAETAFDEIMNLEMEINAITEEVTSRTDFTSEDYTDLLDQLSGRLNVFIFWRVPARTRRLSRYLPALVSSVAISGGIPVNSAGAGG